MDEFQSNYDAGGQWASPAGAIGHNGHGSDLPSRQLLLPYASTSTL